MAGRSSASTPAARGGSLDVATHGLSRGLIGFLRAENLAMWGRWPDGAAGSLEEGEQGAVWGRDRADEAGMSRAAGPFRI